MTPGTISSLFTKCCITQLDNLNFRWSIGTNQRVRKQKKHDWHAHHKGLRRHWGGKQFKRLRAKREINRKAKHDKQWLQTEMDYFGGGSAWYKTRKHDWFFGPRYIFYTGSTEQGVCWAAFRFNDTFHLFVMGMNAVHLPMLIHPLPCKLHPLIAECNWKHLSLGSLQSNSTVPQVSAKFGRQLQRQHTVAAWHREQDCKGNFDHAVSNQQLVPHWGLCKPRSPHS